MPPSWAARWPTTSTLTLQPSHLPSLTSALLSLHVGPHILDMLVKKYGKSSFRSVIPPWSYLNSPPINRGVAVTESATWLWATSRPTSPANGPGPLCLRIRCCATNVRPIRKVQGRGTITNN